MGASHSSEPGEPGDALVSLCRLRNNPDPGALMMLYPAGAYRQYPALTTARKCVERFAATCWPPTF
jgi:hypothetical protein